MYSVIIISGLILGTLLRLVINKISLKLNPTEENKKKIFFDYLVVIVTCTLILISFFKFGISLLFLKAIFLDCILIVASFIDFEHQIIPNYIVIITLIIGIVFIFICDISILNSIMGMILGGGILFLLAFVPNAMGGGDIKWMFALGSFLGAQKILTALFLAFIFAAVISTVFLIFKIKGRKDYIPFGPFLAMGCFVSFHIIFLL